MILIVNLKSTNITPLSLHLKQKLTHLKTKVLPISSQVLPSVTSLIFSSTILPLLTPLPILASLMLLTSRPWCLLFLLLRMLFPQRATQLLPHASCLYLHVTCSVIPCLTTLFQTSLTFPFLSPRLRYLFPSSVLLFSPIALTFLPTE